MVRIFNDLESLSIEAAEIFIDLAEQAILAYGRFAVALSGGNTPRLLYQLLASEPDQKRINWESVHVFWSDERCVPANDPHSNVGMTRQNLLDHIQIPDDNIHIIEGTLPPAEAAVQYETEIKEFFGENPAIFDLILLGLGENAHTASLFPYMPVLDETNRWVADVYVTEQDMYRITFTPRLINQADQVVFLVSGAEKAHSLHEVIEGTYQPHKFPAQLIRPNGRHPVWLVDKAAGHKLTMP